MRLSDAGLALLKEFEGCRLNAYDDGVGVWTIGYGSTLGVKPGDTITREEAERLLREVDLPKFEKEVFRDTADPALGPGRTPTQNQFDAMVCLCYNIGQGNFRQSTVLRRFLQGDFNSAGEAFLMWNKAGGKVLPGLVRRREAERDLFLTKEKS